jgi:hypothetical protein
MLKLAFAVLAVVSMTGLASATTVVTAERVGAGQQIVEAKRCKAGFRLNRSKTRCVAIPQSSGGSFF